MSALSVPLIIVLAAVAWLTAGGMAVRSVSRIWLRHWAERQLRGSLAALAYLERPHRLLAAANVGAAFIIVLAGVLLGIRHDGVKLVWQVFVVSGVLVLAGQM